MTSGADPSEPAPDDILSGAFSEPEIESGRRLFGREWRFIAAANSVAVLPPMRGVEIALCGRSNVGKSSLVNALTGRRALARTSHTPGRTQELIFFSSDGPLQLVDMPGYGYAAVSKQKVEAWTDLIHHYLRGRANLARVYVLVDARHGLKPADEPVFTTLDSAAVSYQVTLTKADAVKPDALAATVAAMRDALRRHPAAYPDVLATSSRTGQGVEALRAAIAKILAERS